MLSLILEFSYLIEVERGRSNQRSNARLEFEALEGRHLLTTVALTDYEQLLVELVNRARMDPQGEVDRLPLLNNLNDGLSPGTISLAPKQPLATVQALIDAAGFHADDMLEKDYFSHTSSPGGESPTQRAATFGYSGGVGENIHWNGTTGTLDQRASTLQAHESLFMSPGHRNNLMNDGYEELGIGARFGEFTSGVRTYNAGMFAENFGFSSDDLYLTGVVYDDSIVDDDFFSVGESLEGVVITATDVQNNQYVTTSGRSGGYNLKLPNGDYEITVQWQQNTYLLQDVTMNGLNIKLDFDVTRAPELQVVVAPSPTDPPTDPDPPPPSDPPTIPVQETPQTPHYDVIDNGDIRYTSSGGWRPWSNSQHSIYQNDIEFAGAGNGSSVATWTFSGLTAGTTFNVASTWLGHANRATNAPFRVTGATNSATVNMNQQQSPTEREWQGQTWNSLGSFVVDSSGVLQVSLSNNANGYVIADAVAIFEEGDTETAEPEIEPSPPQTPQLNTNGSTESLIDDGDTGFQTNGSWSEWSSTQYPGHIFNNDLRFAVAGAGDATATWTFSGLTPGSPQQVSTTWMAHRNRASNATFEITGATNGELRHVNQQQRPSDFVADNQTWHTLGTYVVDSNGTLTVTLTNAANGYVVADAVRIDDATSRIIDNGSVGYLASGNWSRWTTNQFGGRVYDSDLEFASPGDASSSATWTFGGLTPGSSYELATTWLEHANRATNARYQITGATNAGPVEVNQRYAPNDMIADGQTWHILGTFVADSTGTIEVTLDAASADGYVIADAVRISG